MKQDINIIVRKVTPRENKFLQDSTDARYEGFLEGFNGYEVGFVPFDEALQEAKTGKPAQIYSFDPTTRTFSLKDAQGLESQLLLVELYQKEINTSFEEKKKAMQETASYLDILVEEGKVGEVINPTNSLASQDKLWLLDVQKNLPHIPLPQTYHVNSRMKLDELLKEHGPDHIVKARLGWGSRGAYKATDKELKRQANEIIEGSIVQKYVPNIMAEARLVIGPDRELVGAKIFYDRTQPWERDENNKIRPGERLHQHYLFSPAQDLVDKSIELMNHANIAVGSVDWFVCNQIYKPKHLLNEEEILDICTNKSDYYFCELNGFGTNFGPLPPPYDLNSTIANKIVTKYLK